MSRLFGTDGVRGLANRDISAKLALQLSVAGSRVLSRGWTGEKRPFAVVGRDTRVSGEFLSAALSAGIASTGVDVLDAGMLPTPGIAQVVKDTGAAFGVVISASHNPMPDNGIKFFAAGGTKLDDAVEDEILAIFDEDWDRPTGADVGRISRYPAAADEYTEHLVRCVDADNVRPLSGLKVVVDCAHGAASIVGPAALRQAGAEVIVSAAEPDGFNINDGVGSTHLGPLQRLVVETQSDLGVAFDGDADRCLMVDEKGNFVDGDFIMAICALDMKSRGKLAGNAVVGTIMTNLGFQRFCEENGMKFEATKVGDRYVLEEMRLDGYNFGGEQSGHVIFRDFATTGDGQLTACQLLSLLRRREAKLSSLATVMQRYPQTMVNIKVSPEGKLAFYTDHKVRAAIDAAAQTLGRDGRIIVRPSGTEPLLRVMVEGQDEALIEKLAQDVAKVIQEELV